MPKYKLRLPGEGDYLDCEGEPVYVGESAADALTFYTDEYEYLEVEWVHPEILRGRIVYARDIENGDCHEDSVPGDSTFDYVTSDPVNALRPLCDGEVRTWPAGAWRPHWVIEPEWSTGSFGYCVMVVGKIIGQFATMEEAEIAR